MEGVAMTMHVTLNAIRKHSPCQDGWTKLLTHLGKTKADDEPLRLSTVLESNGLDDCLWCMRALPPEYDDQARLLVCDIAERALRFVPDGENRPRIAIETARRFSRGEATNSELTAAWAAAGDAAWAAAWAAARAAERGEQLKIVSAWLAKMEAGE